MLLDKSGMRKRTKEEDKATDKKKGFKQKKPISDKEAHDRAVDTALRFGIGYEQYKKEVDSIRAAQIREKLEKAHIK